MKIFRSTAVNTDATGDTAKPQRKRRDPVREKIRLQQLQPSQRAGLCGSGAVIFPVSQQAPPGDTRAQEIEAF
jgi:hypothetical protein